MSLSKFNTDRWMQMEAFMTAWPILPWKPREHLTLAEREMALGIKFPFVLHEWYSRVKDALPEIPDDIEISDDYTVLVLYNETYVDEDAIEWGILVSELDHTDPSVVVRDHRQYTGVIWKPTRIVLSDFLFLIVAWTVFSRAGYLGSRELAYGLLDIPLESFEKLEKQLDQWGLPAWPYGDTPLDIGGNTEILYQWCGPVALMAKREDSFSQVTAITGFPVEIVTPDDDNLEG